MSILNPSTNRRALTRTHAAAAEYGVNHDLLHDLASVAFDVRSMTQLTTEDLDAITGALIDAADARAYAEALVAFAHDAPDRVAARLADMRLGDGPARSLAACVYHVAKREWPERRVSWTRYWDHARAVGVVDPAAYERLIGRRLPATPDEARAAVDRWVDQRIAADTPPPTQPALLDAPARPRQLAGFD